MAYKIHDEGWKWDGESYSSLIHYPHKSPIAAGAYIPALVYTKELEQQCDFSEAANASYTRPLVFVSMSAPRAEGQILDT